MKHRRRSSGSQFDKISDSMTSLGGGMIGLGTGAALSQSNDLQTSINVGATGLVGAAMLDKIRRIQKRRR